MTYLKNLYLENEKYDLSAKAAQIGYHSIFSLLPFSYFFICLIPYFGIKLEQLQYFSETFFTEDIAVLINGLLVTLYSNDLGTVLSLSLVMAIYSSSTAIFYIIKNIIEINDQKLKSPMLLRVKSILITLYLALILMIFVILQTFSIFNLYKFDVIITSLISIVCISLFLVLIGIIYLTANPNSENWKKIIFGTLLATFLIFVTTFFFNLYLINFSTYSAKFGILGVFTSTMLWFFLLGYTFLFSAVITKLKFS